MQNAIGCVNIKYFDGEEQLYLHRIRLNMNPIQQDMHDHLRPDYNRSG